MAVFFEKNGVKIGEKQSLAENKKMVDSSKIKVIWNFETVKEVWFIGQSL